MVFVTLIPTSFNNGTKVPPEVHQEILDDFWATFGGYTVEGPTQGHWVDPKDQLHYWDECYRVTVSCPSERLQEAEELVRRVGKRLGQKSMFFEVKYFDGVRILDVP